MEDNVVIGAGTTIRCGVTLHKDCVIGAGSLILADVGEGMKVFGTWKY